MGQADWDPDTPQIGSPVEAGTAIEAPADGTTVELPDGAWPGDGTTPVHVDLADTGERMATDDDRARAVAMQLTPAEPDERESDVHWEDTDRIEVQFGRDHDVIGAIRLAMAGASDQHSQIMLIQRLLTYAPDTHPRAIAPTKLLVQAITDEQGQITVPQPF